MRSPRVASRAEPSALPRIDSELLDVADGIVGFLGLAQAGVAQVLFAVDGFIRLGQDRGKDLVDVLVDARVAVGGEGFLEVDDKAAAAGVLLAEGVGDG